jgi:hypothetical protein
MFCLIHKLAKALTLHSFNLNNVRQISLILINNMLYITYFSDLYYSGRDGDL